MSKINHRDTKAMSKSSKVKTYDAQYLLNQVDVTVDTQYLKNFSAILFLVEPKVFINNVSLHNKQSLFFTNKKESSALTLNSNIKMQALQITVLKYEIVLLFDRLRLLNFKFRNLHKFLKSKKDMYVMYHPYNYQQACNSRKFPVCEFNKALNETRYMFICKCINPKSCAKQRFALKCTKLIMSTTYKEPTLGYNFIVCKPQQIIVTSNRPINPIEVNNCIKQNVCFNLPLECNECVIYKLIYTVVTYKQLSYDYTIVDHQLYIKSHIVVAFSVNPKGYSFNYRTTQLEFQSLFSLLIILCHNIHIITFMRKIIKLLFKLIILYYLCKLIDVLCDNHNGVSIIYLYNNREKPP